MSKVCIIDNQSELPAFRVREYFDKFNIDCFITNNSLDEKIDIKLFVSDKDETIAKVLLGNVEFFKAEDGCPMCGASNYGNDPGIITKLFNLKRKYNNYCNHCAYKW